MVGASLGPWIGGYCADYFGYRVPFFIETATFGTAIVITLVATTGSLAIVRRRLQKLDLIAVLKTRE